MTWPPHQIAALHQWPAITLTVLLIFFMCRLAKRRSKSGDWVITAILGEIVLLGGTVLGALLISLLRSRFLSLDVRNPQTVWTAAFYIFYSFVALLGALSIPRVIAELRDAVKRMAIALRRPNLRRLSERNDVEGLWDACLFDDWRISGRTCFRTEWTADSTLREQALLIVACLDRLGGLFKRSFQMNRGYDIRRASETLGERRMPNAAGALFWAVRHDVAVAAALEALKRQPADELQRCCDWGALTAVACGQDEQKAALALDICCNIADPRGAEVLAAAMKNKLPAIRVRAAIHLAEQKDPRAVAPLSALLSTSSPRETERILELLGRIGDPNATDAIVPLLKNPACALAAARALARLNWSPATDTEAVMLHIANADLDSCAAMGPTAVMPLIAALAFHDADCVVLVTALGRIGDSRAVAPLCSLVKDDAPEGLIGAVAGALGGLGAGGRAALLEMATKRPAGIRRAALAVLGRQAPEAAAEIAERLLEGEGALPPEALELVAALGPAAVPPLCAAARTASDQRIASIIGTVVQLGGAAAFAEAVQARVPLLIAAAKSRDSEARSAAVEILKHVPPAQLSKHLLNELQQSTRMPAQVMVELLSRAAPQAADALLALLRSSRDAEVLAIASEVLANAGDHRAAPLIFAALKKERLALSKVRPCLVRLGGAAVEGLCELLPSCNLEVSRILAEIGDRRAIAPLANALMTNNEHQVAACAAALEALGWRPANDAPSAWYFAYKGRLDACSALGAVAVPALGFAVGYYTPRPWNEHAGNEDLRRKAIAALGKSGDASALDVLVPLLKTGDTPHRKLAAQSLMAVAKRATFTEEQRIRLLAAREYVTHHADSRGPHTDYARHFDKSASVPSHDCYDSSTSHDDVPNPVNYSRFADIRHKDSTGPHTDEGLGMEFPL